MRDGYIDGLDVRLDAMEAQTHLGRKMAQTLPQCTRPEMITGDPHDEFSKAYDDFDIWWKGHYSHCDAVLRGIAAAAFMAGRGFDLSGIRLIIESGAQK